MCLLSLVIRSIPININDSLSLFCVLSLLCVCVFFFASYFVSLLLLLLLLAFLHFLWNHRHCNLYEMQVTRQRKHRANWCCNQKRPTTNMAQVNELKKNETTRNKCANSSMSLFLESLIFYVVRISRNCRFGWVHFLHSVDWLRQGSRSLAMCQSQRNDGILNSLLPNQETISNSTVYFSSANRKCKIKWRNRRSKGNSALSKNSKCVTEPIALCVHFDSGFCSSLYSALAHEWSATVDKSEMLHDLHNVKVSRTCIDCTKRFFTLRIQCRRFRTQFAASFRCVWFLLP